MNPALTRLGVATTVVIALFAVLAGTASAQDPAVSVEPATGLSDGDVIVVTISGFAAGAEVTLAQCVVWPVTGPTDCDLSTFGDYVIVADESGGGTGDFPVFVGTIDSLTCDASNPCYLVASDGFGADAPVAGTEISFGGGEAPAEPTAAPTEEATPEQISEMPQTGGEAGLMAIIGVSIVIAGGLFIGFGRRLGKI